MTIEPIHCLAGDIRPGVKCDISCWQNYVFEKGSDKATSIICKRGGGWVSSFSSLKWTVWGKGGRSGVKMNCQSGFNRAILVTESGWPSMDGLKDFKWTICESGRPWNQKDTNFILLIRHFYISINTDRSFLVEWTSILIHDGLGMTIHFVSSKLEVLTNEVGLIHVLCL